MFYGEIEIAHALLQTVDPVIQFVPSKPCFTSFDLGTANCYTSLRDHFTFRELVYFYFDIRGTIFPEVL